MIDHPQGGDVITPDGSGMGDPFLMEERDPLESNARLSSLWEIKALQHHKVANVASAAARFLRDPIPSVENDMGTALERTGGHYFDREIKNKVKDIMQTFERPQPPKDNRLLPFWQFTTMR